MKTKAIPVLLVAALIGFFIFAPTIVSAETVEEWNKKGIGFFTSGEYERAIECFDTVIELNPNLGVPYSNRGAVYFYSKQYESAIDDYSNVIALNPDDAQAYNQRARAYYELKQYGNAQSGVLATIEITSVPPLGTPPTIEIGQSVVFTAEGKDQDGNTVPIPDPQWFSDGVHGTIVVDPGDANKCTYTATAEGADYIQCCDGPPGTGIHGSLDFTVVDGGGTPVPTSVVMTPETATITKGDSVEFTVTVFDQNNEEMPSEPVTFTAEGGTITPEGVYTGNEVGEHTITVKVTSDPAIVDTSTVTVDPVTSVPTSVVMTPETVTITKGDSVEFTVTVFDQNNEEMPSEPVTFTAEGGTITPEGVYTGNEVGEHTITVKVTSDPTIVDTSSVKVIPPGTPVETATGTGTAYFATDAGTLENLVAIDESTLPEEGKPNLVFPHGFFSFDITGLTPCTHQKVVVTITLPSAVPVGTQYWKYHVSEGGWIRIPMGSDDGDEVITITLEDGGLGDDDGECNGVIVDSGGPGTPLAPDLVITEKWVCWPDNCTICYNVTNIGTGTAPACHNTALYVDGAAVAHDHVPVDLEPGESYIGCFDGYTWAYTPPSDEIKVCADNNETLEELDEDNNCLTNIWMCGDVNCDEKVTMSDVRKVFNRYLDPNYPLDLPWAADVNCDGKVTMSDVRKVSNRYLDPGYELNCCCEGVG